MSVTPSDRLLLLSVDWTSTKALDVVAEQREKSTKQIVTQHRQTLPQDSLSLSDPSSSSLSEPESSSSLSDAPEEVPPPTSPLTSLYTRGGALWLVAAHT